MWHSRVLLRNFMVISQLKFCSPIVRSRASLLRASKPCATLTTTTTRASERVTRWRMERWRSFARLAWGTCLWCPCTWWRAVVSGVWVRSSSTRCCVSWPAACTYLRYDRSAGRTVIQVNDVNTVHACAPWEHYEKCRLLGGRPHWSDVITWLTTNDDFLFLIVNMVTPVARTDLLSSHSSKSQNSYFLRGTGFGRGAFAARCVAESVQWWYKLSQGHLSEWIVFNLLLVKWCVWYMWRVGNYVKISVNIFSKCTIILLVYGLFTGIYVLHPFSLYIDLILS